MVGRSFLFQRMIESSLNPGIGMLADCQNVHFHLDTFGRKPRELLVGHMNGTLTSR